MSTPAKIAIIFSVISSLLLVSRARFVPDGIFPFSTAVSKLDPLEITDRSAIVVPLEKSHGGSISAAIEPFHHVDLSLRHLIGRHIRGPINPHFLLRLRHGCHNHRHGRPGRREIPYGDDMIAFPRSAKIPRAFPGEMRLIPMMGPRIHPEGISQRGAADGDGEAGIRARVLEGEGGDGSRDEGGRGEPGRWGGEDEGQARGGGESGRGGLAKPFRAIENRF